MNLGNKTQLERYKKLLVYIEEHFKDDLNIEVVESVCHYSYRNINRIFEAIHNETIGKYIKRLRLEKAAQYLAYSQVSIADISVEVGFEDRAAFSKAFKNKYHLSPSAFRSNKESMLEHIQQSFNEEQRHERQKLHFDIEYLPEFSYIFLEFRGNYEDTSAIEKIWTQLTQYAIKHNLLNTSMPMTQIIDDEEISDAIHSRYNFGFAMEQSIAFVPEGLFRVKQHHRQKYAKFVYQGSDKNSVEFYQEIYAFWMTDVGLELVDLPPIELYPNYTDSLPEEELITEIYIPVK